MPSSIKDSDAKRPSPRWRQDGACARAVHPRRFGTDGDAKTA